MCLAVPMQVIERRGEMGRVEQAGVQRQVSFAMLPDAQPGDFVLVHAGFAIERLDQQLATETIELLEKMQANYSHESEDRK